MAAADTVSLTYTADVSDLKKKMAEVTGATAAETRKAVKELAKANRAVEQSAKMQRRYRKATTVTTQSIKDMGAATGQTARLTSSLAMQLPDVASQLATGTSPALIAVQQGMQVVQVNMGLMTSAAKSAAGVLAGPLGLALAGVVAVGAVFANRLDEVNSSLDAMRKSARDAYVELDPELVKRAAAAHRELQAAISGANNALLMEQAGLTSLDKAQIQAIDSARESAQVVLLETSARWARLEVQRQELQAAVANSELSVKDALAARVRLGQLKEEMPIAEAKIAAIREELGVKIESINASFNERAALKAATAATKERTAATDEDVRSRANLFAQINAMAQAEGSLSALQADLAAGSDEWARKELGVNRQLAQRVALLDEIAQQTGVTAELDAAYLAAQEDADSQISDMQQERFEKARDGYAQLQEASRAAADAEIADRRRVATMTVTSLSDLAQASGDAVMAMAQANSGATKRGMMAAWAIQKALSLAIIPLKLAEGMMAAAALPPPASGIKRAAVIATAAGSTAMIASSKPPKFNDTPGVIQVNGGGSVGVAPGDFMVAGKDLGDMQSQISQALDRPAPRVEVVAIPSYSGRTYERARRDAYRRPGPDFDAINRDRSGGPGGW